MVLQKMAFPVDHNEKSVLQEDNHCSAYAQPEGVWEESKEEQSCAICAVEIRPDALSSACQSTERVSNRGTLLLVGRLVLAAGQVYVHGQ